MQFRTMSEVNNDIRLWAESLPPISAVAGIPRSGVLVASMLAQVLNIPLVPLENVLKGEQSFRPQCSRKLSIKTGPVLVLDDTIWAGRTFKGLNLPSNVVKGAVYSSPHARGLIDFTGFQVDTIKHEFSYNILSTRNCIDTATDMDGVLCPDWPHSDIGEHQTGYENFLATTKPRRVPRERVQAIVTARLEKYRHVTERWLAKQGICYNKLIMSPFTTAEERNIYGHGKWKSEVLRDLYRSRKICMFVESSLEQAKEIAQRTGRCTLAFLDDICFNSQPMKRLF